MKTLRENYKTEQEVFWAGDFGDDYTDRNSGDLDVSRNVAMFQQVFKNIVAPKTVIEFGANRGLNLLALKSLFPDATFTGIEINAKAAEELSKIDRVTAIHSSILDYPPTQGFDLVLAKGILIHINPAELAAVYQKLHEASGRYILIAEYYNPTPVAIPYRGHSDRLFKREFAGEMLDLFDDLALVDYGFCYHRDPIATQDDVNWFLLKKQKLGRTNSGSGFIKVTE
jgi:pseudaminic acid biosynthesis-associated methylase